MPVVDNNKDDKDIATHTGGMSVTNKITLQSNNPTKEPAAVIYTRQSGRLYIIASIYTAVLSACTRILTRLHRITLFL